VIHDILKAFPDNGKAFFVRKNVYVSRDDCGRDGSGSPQAAAVMKPAEAGLT
jgi:hypothetical protein